MSEQRGLYDKYRVTKADGRPIDDEAFVLRPDQDEAAQIALRAYAEATDNDALRADLIEWLEILPKDGFKRRAVNAQPNADDVEALAHFMSKLGILRIGWKAIAQRVSKVFAARETQMRRALGNARTFYFGGHLQAIGACPKCGGYIGSISMPMCGDCMEKEINAALAIPFSQAARQVRALECEHTAIQTYLDDGGVLPDYAKEAHESATDKKNR